jgi:hypothetical protein
MTGGSPMRLGISIALRKLLPKPSPAYGSPYKNYDRHERAKNETCSQARAAGETTDESNLMRMSAFGALRTFHVAFDVAFGGKADTTFCAAHVCF